MNCYYDGAPEYRIELRAPDFKTAEDTWTASIAAVVSVIEEAGGTADSTESDSNASPTAPTMHDVGWCLETTCPHVAEAQAAAPLKWSPEDHRANIRRQLNNVESPDWSQILYTSFAGRNAKWC